MANTQCPNVGFNTGFIDTTRVIHSDDANYSTDGITPWQATEDCWCYASVYSKQAGTGAYCTLDGVYILYGLGGYQNTIGGVGAVFPVKKGQVIASRTGSTNHTCSITCYGMKY